MLTVKQKELPAKLKQEIKMSLSDSEIEEGLKKVSLAHEGY